ncbi:MULTISPECIES: glycosyltransferase [Arthrobacter]|uniref:Glycosyltransferase n=2 Tax=Arthrobacter TaxID=1663 RepID=A0ABU9KLJ6_9MICC|nr:glycosyltransferase [Arthrobacter sp. YJM1]MDP5227723.1 glycosyltransferase [Arthrobacter sp. YJM1]
MSRVLLISPAFHGYYRSIAAALEQQGHEVIAYAYDFLGSFPDKLRNKIRFELPARLGAGSGEEARRWATDRVLSVLRKTNPDRVVVIKGDSLDSRFWDAVNSRNIPRVLWLYDDLKRHDYSFEFLREIGPVASYAKSEVQVLAEHGVNATWLPNGFDPDLAQPTDRRSGEVVFVGSRYPNRVALMEALMEAGVPLRVYGRQWSHHWVDRLRTWELSRPQLPSERDIPLSEAYRVQAEAAAAINIHGLQEGLAMRTFEVPGMGGLQLIDREDVAEFYEPGKEVLVFRSQDELVELAAKVVREPGWGQGIREAGRRRSLAEHTFAHRMCILDGMWSA